MDPRGWPALLLVHHGAPVPGIGPGKAQAMQQQQPLVLPTVLLITLTAVDGWTVVDLGKLAA